MKRISIGLALYFALGNPSSIIASPLLIAAALAQICPPHIGKKILDYQDSMLKTKALETIAAYKQGHEQELRAMIERFTHARIAVFGQTYFNNARTNSNMQAWKNSTVFKNGARIYFALDHVNDDINGPKFLTTLGLYYKATKTAQAVLLQRRRVELPKTTMPKPGDANYDNDATYIASLTADMDRYMAVSTTDVTTLISNSHANASYSYIVVAHYRKQTQLIESTN